MRYTLLMKKIHIYLLLPMILTGCLNKTGISGRYYTNCEEYYDSQGYYHKQCDPNLIDYHEIQEKIMSDPNPQRGSVR